MSPLISWSTAERNLIPQNGHYAIAPSASLSMMVCGGLARSAAAQQYRSVQSNHAAGRQGLNLGLAVTDLSQNLPGVLAETGWLVPDREHEVVAGDRSASGLDGRAGLGLHLHQLAAVELRVAEQIKRIVQRCVGYLDPLHPLDQLGRGQAGSNGFDPRDGAMAVRSPLGVAIEIRIGGQVCQSELLAEALPVAIAGDRDEDLAVIGGLEQAVDAPAHARPHSPL